MTIFFVGYSNGYPSSNPGPGCISHSVNPLREMYNPIILPPVMDELGSLALVWLPV